MQVKFYGPHKSFTSRALQSELFCILQTCLKLKIIYYENFL